MNKIQAIILTVVFTTVAVVLPLTQAPVVSQVETADAITVCDIFPFLEDLGLSNSLCGTESVEGQAEDNLTTAAALIRFGLSLIFIGIIAIAVFTIIKAAIQYIRSEGEEEKIQSSQKSIKAVFIGIGALLVGIIGLVIVLAFFDAGTAVTTDEGTGVDPLDGFVDDLQGGE